MKRLQMFLKVFVFVLICACSFRVFAIYNDFTRHTELYATYSAPWYADIISTVVITAILVLSAIITYCIAGHVIKKRKQDQTDNKPTE